MCNSQRSPLLGGRGRFSDSSKKKKKKNPEMLHLSDKLIDQAR